jgi:hypothetical protein
MALIITENLNNSFFKASNKDGAVKVVTYYAAVLVLKIKTSISHIISHINNKLSFKLNN